MVMDDVTSSISVNIRREGKKKHFELNKKRTNTRKNKQLKKSN